MKILKSYLYVESGLGPGRGKRRVEGAKFKEAFILLLSRLTLILALRNYKKMSNSKE